MSVIPDLLSPEVAANPGEFYKRLRKESPVHFDSSVNAYLISRFEDVVGVYREPIFSTKAYAWQLEPVHGRTILQMDGREHSKRRAIVAPSVRGEGLERWMPIFMRDASDVIDDIVRRSAEHLSEQFDEDRPVDLVTEFANYYPVNVIADMLGLDKSDHDMFHGWYTSVIRVISNLGRDPEILLEAERTRKEIGEFMIPLIEERRNKPGKDMVSLLVNAEVDGESMSVEEIRAYVSLLLTAGAETTDKTFASLMRNLLQSPESIGAVKADRTLTTNAIAETLRFSPPTQINTREVTEDIEVAGVTIPEGSTVLALIGSANHDEARFLNPDTFDMFRADLNVRTAFTGAADHVAFGTGRHFCLGALLARSELETGVNVLLDRFPDIRLAPGADTSDVGLKMRGPRSVEVLLGS
jgi:cytochrome P450